MFATNCVKTISPHLINIRSRSIMSISNKIIVIVGTTGVGKSDLSIELAKKFNGEIINADSMQMYRDVPIITNKHPIPERAGIPHHVMNHVNWNEEYFIHRFENECINAIEDIRKRGKLPIVVGGTHYYLQVLFNKIATSAEESNSKNSDVDTVNELTEEQKAILESKNSQLIYEKLLEVDPEIASRYHPNDERRVQRMLEIFYTTGEKPSKTFRDQVLKLKYDTLFFWLYSQPKELNERCDKRVDKMLDTGGMEEINQLYKYYKENDFSIEQCENGIWQVIGFKEFLPWLEDKDSVSLEDCIEKMKIRTRQYAKRQVKWIKKMLIPDINGKNIYLLNATDLSKWHQLVRDRGIRIAESFLKNTKIEEDQATEDMAYLISPEETIERKKMSDWKHYECDICRDSNDKKLIAIGEKNWQIHLKSKRHRSNSTRGHKKAEYEKWKLQQKENI